MYGLRPGRLLTARSCSTSNSICIDVKHRRIGAMRRLIRRIPWSNVGIWCLQVIVGTLLAALFLFYSRDKAADWAAACAALASASAAFLAWRTSERSAEAARESANATIRSAETAERIADIENYRARKDFDPTEHMIVSIPHPHPAKPSLEIEYRGDFDCAIVVAEWYANARGSHCDHGGMKEVCRGSIGGLPEQLAPQEVFTFPLLPITSRVHEALLSRCDLWAMAGGRVTICFRWELSPLPGRIRSKRKMYWIACQVAADGSFGINTVDPNRYDFGPWLRGESESPYSHPSSRPEAPQ